MAYKNPLDDLSQFLGILRQGQALRQGAESRKYREQEIARNEEKHLAWKQAQKDENEQKRRNSYNIIYKHFFFTSLLIILIHQVLLQ